VGPDPTRRSPASDGSTHAVRGRHSAWHRVAWSAVTTAAIAALFAPIPAMAAPNDAPPAAVPDTGSRPAAIGSVVMPGQSSTSTIPINTGVPVGGATTPLMAKVEKRRADVALLGDRLLELRAELDIARDQATTATAKQTEARQAVLLAEEEARSAPSSALKTAAAMPPGAIGSGLQGLEGLARIQRGESGSDQSAVRRLALAQEFQLAADAEVTTTSAHLTEMTGQHDKLFTKHSKEQTALTELEEKNAAAIAAAEAAEAARNQELGLGYTGSIDGKGADPRAVAALRYAKSQIGDWYVWSTEGPDTFDCSGLMYAAYRTAAAGSLMALPRVSRDQYYWSRDRVVDRYSLLPGDLLFFSSSNSWKGIHHVAMYAGDGMMVEAARKNTQVRVVPVRWNRLFQATRMYAAVDGGATDGGPVEIAPNPTKPTKPTKTPAPIKTTKPPTTDPEPTGTTKPPTSKPPTTTPVPDPTTPKPIPTPTSNPADKPSTSPADGSADGSPSGGSSAGADATSSSKPASASKTTSNKPASSTKATPRTAATSGR
jgi:cell wall-associated NlpC family hydrolase